MTQTEITELASAHWGYVKSVLEAHDEDPTVIEQCGFHYREAFTHGYKHGVESCGVEMKKPRKRRRNSNAPGDNNAD